MNGEYRSGTCRGEAPDVLGFIQQVVYIVLHFADERLCNFLIIIETRARPVVKYVRLILDFLCGFGCARHANGVQEPVFCVVFVAEQFEQKS